MHGKGIRMSKKKLFSSLNAQAEHPISEDHEVPVKSPKAARYEAISLSLASRDFNYVVSRAYDDNQTIVIVENGKAVVTVSRYQDEELPFPVSYSAEAIAAVEQHDGALHHNIHEKVFYREKTPVVLGSYAKTIDRKTIIQIHDTIASEHSFSDDIRDENALDYVLKKPFLEIGGTMLYPTIEEMAACLACEIVTRKPFKEGNVDTAAISYATFLHVNGNDYEPGPDLFKMLFAAGEGADIYSCLVREACWHVEC